MSLTQVSNSNFYVRLPVSGYDLEHLRRETQSVFESDAPKTVIYQLAEPDAWNSKTLAAINLVDAISKKYGTPSDYAALPEGVGKILALSKPPVDDGKNHERSAADLFLLVGKKTLDAVKSSRETFAFIGEALGSFKRLFLGKAQYQRSDLAGFIQAVGPQALPIIGLVNLLLGVILAFMGAVQLQQFGAEIYVANLVALGQTREIAPMMTAIVLAGRTGAAYAAQLGTMQVNEEIDALKTFGFSPMDFLVLPRMAALAIMTPVLVLYADAIGIFGGYLIGMSLLGIGAVEYVVQTQNAIGLGDIALGVVKGSIFGILVAITGCMQGMNSGRSASAVGDAATSAVVNGIVAIIVATAIFAVLTNALGI